MNELLQFSAQVELTAAAGDGSKPPQISILGYAGGEIDVGGYGAIVVDLAGMETSSSIPILAEHQRDLDSLLGTGTASKQEGKLYINGILTRANPLVEKIVSMNRDGVALSASIGASPIERQFIQPGQSVSVNRQKITAGKNGLTLVSRSVLREISIVAVAADAATNVSISASLKGKSPMSKELYAGKTEEEVRAELKAALPENQLGATTMERVEARWNRSRWHDATGGPRTRAQKAMIAAAGGKIGYEEFENQLLEAQLADTELALMYSELPKGPQLRSSSRDMGNNMEIMQAALLCHLGHEEISAKSIGDQATQRARDMKLNSLHDILRCSLMGEGKDVPHGSEEMIKAAFSTASISNIISNVANKISQASYQAVPSVARVIAKKLSANDFKEHTGVMLTIDGSFERVNPLGQIKHGTLGDSKFTYSVETYGKMFGLTRQDVRNDDLGKFEEVPRLLGRNAAMKVESLFWTLVLANTGSFFSAANKNYIDGTGSALSISGLAAGVQLCRDMVDINGDPVLVEPKYLVAPTTLEVVANQLYQATNVVVAGNTDSTQPNAQVFAGKFQPLITPYLNNAKYIGNSDTGWYLFGDPADVAAFGIAYLDGVEYPKIEQQEAEFSSLGIQLRGYLDFGVCQIDPKGAVMSKGTT